MSEEHAHAGTGHDDHGHHDHSAHYFSVFKLLVIFFIISFIGPFIADFMTEQLGVPHIVGFLLTMITAFGVAFLKARLVIVHFMHLPQEKPYIGYILQTCLVLIAIFIAGVMVDVLNHEGQNWTNDSAKAAVENGKAALEALKAGKH
ncbi:MAG: cytochrome C oxidase subunit IV family protein [Deltaproteobacteria bacterium]|jgi:caa(3)-type oxidase subunit IV|nr:cytochrome C oxidase subunit IV family protein [Deltaproteobacteria bacterium]MBT6431802.1 cytochrome C oxidase subunit IV family protein [Deltaproteobacteria bacterium]MBT6490871.1 cytochrome C oxidase subunit IV family protein [Deltaproteobacteria bacterium]